MTNNIPSTLVNMLVWGFILVVILCVGLAAYAATQLRKAQESAAVTAGAPAIADDFEEVAAVAATADE